MKKRFKNGRKSISYSDWRGILFSLPYVIVFVIGIVLPLMYSAYLGLFRTRVFDGTTFSGLFNYIKALTDIKLWSGYGRVLVYGLIQVPLIMFMSVLAALILDSGRLHHVALPRLLLFIPYAVPGVIATVMWSYMYGNEYGLIGEIYNFFGLNAPDILSGNLILFAIANIVIWCFMGYNTLIYYSALKVIPEDIYEAARIDGASEVRIAWSIKVRHIRSSLVMTLIFNLIGAAQLFNEPNLLQVIAPETITSSFTPTMYSYNLAFAGQNVSYSAAVALIIGLVAMIIIGITKVIGDRWSDD